MRCAKIAEPDDRNSHAEEFTLRAIPNLPVTTIDTRRIFVGMSNTESGFNEILGEDHEEFSMPEFRDHFADSLTPAVLREWSAADFASIYVRFLPHLERHARKFLVNPSQVEEVVQDAFLYLMTTLPELDSELGVLKFLKWKVRLLCLDVIRSNSKTTISPIEAQPDLVAEQVDVSERLERADDAAVVSLALAKLQPRHREALIATLYEEKSTEVVAAQMGLTENAFRQLLFRARSSFKKALVGEAETQGRSISEILSIAARKAAQESGKIISAAGAFLLVLAVSIGVLPNLSFTPAEEQLSLPMSSQAPQPAQESPTEEDSPVSEAPLSAEPQEPEQAPEPEAAIAIELESSATTSAPESVSVEAAAGVQEDERDIIEEFMLSALDAQALRTLSSSQLGEVSASSLNSSGTLVVSNGTGLVANVAYDLDSETGIQHVWVGISYQDHEFVAVPRVDLAEKITDDSGNIKLRYLASDFLIGDVKGQFDFITTDKAVFSSGALRLEINLDSQGRVMGSTLYASPKA